MGSGVAREKMHVCGVMVILTSTSYDRRHLNESSSKRGLSIEVLLSIGPLLILLGGGMGDSGDRSGARALLSEPRGRRGDRGLIVKGAVDPDGGGEGSKSS